MTNQTKRRLISVVAMLLSVVMVLGVCPLSVFAATTTTQGLWTVVNEDASGTATYGDIGFTYYSPSSTISSGNSGGKDYVKSGSTNGSASNGIVTTNGKSYCDFTAKADGTLTVYVGNASAKTGYVSKKDASGTNTAVGSYVPGGTGEYDATGFKVTQGTSYATLEIEVEKDYTYYVCLSGSKMVCYGAEYVAYTNVSGTITDKFNLGSYAIKFTNKTTNESTTATVDGNSYSVLLKPNYQYSAALTGSNATGYGFTTATRLVDVEVADTQTANLEIEESTAYTLSGALTGLATVPTDTELIFVPEDAVNHEEVRATIDTAAKTYSAQLVANETYTLKLVGAYDYKLTDEIKVSNDNSNAITKDVAFTENEKYAVSGGFLGLTQVRGQYETLTVNPTAISFKNVEDGYTYSGAVADGKYSVALRNGSYLASITADGYSTSTHIVVAGSAVTRDLLLKDTSKKTVEYKDTVYVGADKEYKTVQAAVDAVTNMTRANGERVTIKLDPGTYREQVVVSTPNITLESNGGTRDNTKITWYYGIGYKYYSTVNSVYDPYADYDKFEKGDVVSYWGSAVITNKTAEGFRAKDITFENSFNKYMTDEEMTDGVEPNGLESINVVRKETTNVDSKAATERAAAYVNYADKTEFSNCAFIGSQDTLYTCNVAYDAYYKNCYIEGQTDFIYGNGDVIFDGCEINFCGYDGTEAAGYITANSCSKQYTATDGYIFRSCYISYNGERDVTPGYLGRMWGDSAKVAFINTQLQESNMLVGAGWYKMNVEPTASTVTLKEYNTTCNGVKVDTSSRVNGVVDSINAEDYSVESVFTANGWTPAYYTVDATTVPEFASEPTMISNGDLNTPNPGETITLSYALGDAWANEDASRISWYAVAEDYDATSLDTILKSATLLKTTSAVSTNKFQIPMECVGKYIMAVVTPITNSGLTGTAKYIIDSEKPVSSTWSDPDNEGSIAPGTGINIYLAGDSTVKDYSAAGIYNGGKTLDSGSWGEFLQSFFDKDYVTVNNYAQGGRSTRSFLNEGKLDTILNNIKAGDYLLIQFGHNDCSNGAAYYEERFAPLYTKDNPKTDEGYPTIVPTEDMKVETPTAYKSTYGDKYYSWDCGATYKGYLQYYIDKTLEKGAIPVIVSPVSRLYYNSDGTIKAHHDANMTDYAATTDYLTTGDAYVTACKEVYEANKDNGVLYIDAFNLTKTLYEDAYTACGSDANGFAVMASGDKTHSNKTGGVIQAGIFAKWIQDANISASPYVIQPTTVYGENSDGEYIFTIKNSVFTAKDNSYTENSYWSEYGQALFDSIGNGSDVTPTPDVQSVSLNFADDDTMNVYEAEDSYTDGEYAGTYTNESGQSFDVVVYKDAISYYNHQSRYGTKATVGSPIFSFVADEKAMYTLTFGAGTGSATISLYTDAACTNSVVSGDVPGSVVYKKTTDTPETIYVATSAANNYYMSTATITKAELPDDVKVTFKGAVTGIESDDTNVVITLKSSTETLTVNADDYAASGIELITGETYAITAKGDKGVYIGTDIVPDNSGVADIVLSRISFAFPFDFVENYDDYKTYFSVMGYGDADLTDPYSGITVHPNGIVMSDGYKQYGVKTNANSILSFVTEKTGACTVEFDSSVSNSDKLILKVNDTYAPNLVSVASGDSVKLTVIVNEGDTVTLYTPTRSNLWYKSLDVSYADAAFVYANAVVNGDEVMLYGTVEDAMTDNIEKVGFMYSTGVVSSLDGYEVADESSSVYSVLNYNGESIEAEGNKLFGTVLNELTGIDSVYVYTFCTTSDGNTYYSAPIEVKLN